MDRYEFVDIEELLDKDLGELRESFAYENPQLTLRTILIQKGWLIDSEDNDDLDEDYDDEEEDYEEDEEDYWNDEEDESFSTPSNLSEEEVELACDIANDIDNGNYTLDSIRGLYSTEFIDYVEEMLD